MLVTWSKCFEPPALRITGPGANRFFPAQARAISTRKWRNASTLGSASLMPTPITSSKPSTPTSASSGAAATARARSSASSRLRQPVRPPATPPSSSTSTGRPSGWSRSSCSSARTPASKSTTPRNSKVGSASSSAITVRIAWRPISWLASSTRGTPKRRQTMSCCTVATVIPKAPSASWRANSCGAIVVLPCGHRRTSKRSRKPRIQRLLCASAEPFSTATGSGRSWRSRFQPCRPTAPSGRAPASAGQPLVVGSTGAFNMSSTFIGIPPPRLDRRTIDERPA